MENKPLGSGLASTSYKVAEQPESDQQTKNTPFSSHDAKKYLPTGKRSAKSSKNIGSRKIHIQEKSSLFKSEDFESLRQELKKLGVHQGSVRQNQQLLWSSVNAVSQQLQQQSEQLDSSRNDVVSDQDKTSALQRNKLDKRSVHKNDQSRLNATKIAHKNALSQLKILQQSTSKYENTIQILQDQLKKLNAQSPQSLQLTDNNKALTQAKDQLQEIAAENIQLKQVNQNLETTCTKQQEEIALRALEVSTLKESLDFSTLEAENSKKQISAFDDIATEYQQLQQVNKALSQEFEQQIQEAEELNKILLQKEKQINELQTQLLLQQPLPAPPPKIVRVVDHTAVEAKQQEIIQLRQTIQQLKATVTQIKNIPKEEKKELKKIKKELSQLKNRNSAVENNYTQMVATNQKLIETLKKQERYIQELKQK